MRSKKQRALLGLNPTDLVDACFHAMSFWMDQKVTESEYRQDHINLLKKRKYESDGQLQQTLSDLQRSCAALEQEQKHLEKELEESQLASRRSDDQLLRARRELAEIEDKYNGLHRQVAQRPMYGSASKPREPSWDRGSSRDRGGDLAAAAARAPSYDNGHRSLSVSRTGEVRFEPSFTGALPPRSPRYAVAEHHRGGNGQPAVAAGHSPAWSLRGVGAASDFDGRRGASAGRSPGSALRHGSGGAAAVAGGGAAARVRGKDFVGGGALGGRGQFVAASAQRTPRNLIYSGRGRGGGTGGRARGVGAGVSLFSA